MEKVFARDCFSSPLSVAVARTSQSPFPLGVILKYIMENFNIDGNGNIIINEIDGSTIIINPDNSEEIKKLIINFGNSLEKLPIEVLNLIENKQSMVEKNDIGANLYLTTLAELGTYHRALKFGLTITNLTKEHRYFNQPSFKVFPKFDLGDGMSHDTFIMMHQEEILLPKRLEYGEPFTLTFELKDGFIDMCQKAYESDESGYIQAFVSTTVGELYESEKFTFKKLFENIKWIKQ